MEAVVKQLTSKEAMNLIAQVQSAFKSLPHLPKGITEFLVKVAPWLAVIGGALSVFGALSNLAHGLGYGSALKWVGFSTEYMLLAGIGQLLIGALLLLSFKYLKERMLTGWVLVFWEMVISTVMTVLAIVMGYGSLIGSVIGILIGFYILFEMKPSYK